MLKIIFVKIVVGNKMVKRALGKDGSFLRVGIIFFNLLKK
jgi:hypothetical protein